jgi:hypothetical protein
MNPRRYFLLLALFALALSGCAGTLGVWPHQALSSQERERVLEELKKNWQDYDVYSDGPVEQTAAVIFDPRKDERKLLGYGYVKVGKERDVEVAVNWVLFHVTFNPTLYRIYDDEGRFYGYLLIALYVPVPRRVDDRTLMLPQHQSPLYFVG